VRGDTGSMPEKKPGIVHHAIPGYFKKKRGKKMKKMITHCTYSIPHWVLRKKARFF
jgi:hypothetical protein